MEINGTLIKKLPEQGGESKNGAWKKQNFVIETQETYPKKICLTLWKDKVEQLNDFKEGDFLKVNFSIESREYNNNWYTDLNCFRIDSANNSFGNKKDEQFPMPTEKDIPNFDSPASEDDDLPF